MQVLLCMFEIYLHFTCSIENLTLYMYVCMCMFSTIEKLLIIIPNK